MKTILLATAMGCVTLAGRLAESATINWTNTASGNWGNAANWNPNQVPGATDTAIITNAGVTVTLDIIPTVGGIILGTNGAGTVTLSLAGQTLALNGPLTVNPSGSFTVDSGTLVGNPNTVLTGTIGWSAGSLGGILTLAAGSALNITTGNNHNMPSLTFTNNGTVAWNNGTIQAGGSPGTLIVNNGVWDAQSDQIWNNAYSFNGTIFNNYGTFRKSGGVSEGGHYTELSDGVVFNQLAGVLDVQNGTNGLQLLLLGSGNFTGGYVTTNSQGLTDLYAPGTFNINGTVTGTNTWLNGGNLINTNVINGALTWMAGTWSGAPFVTIASNSTVLLAGGVNNLDMNTAVVTNYGTLAWSSGTIRGGNGTAIYNYGLWDAQSDQQFQTLGGSVVFNNYSTFRKSGGVSEGGHFTELSDGVVFNQLAGVLDVQNGTNGLQLLLLGSGNFTGGYITTNSQGLTDLYAPGTFNINGTVTGTNTWLNGGNLVGTNVINGALTWIAGTWSGAPFVTIASNSTVLLAGGVNNLDMNAAVVTNYGTLAWSSGTIRGGNGTAIYNYGLWDAQSDQQFQTLGGSVVFNNYSTFRKSAGTEPNSTTIQSGVGFVNNGTVDAQNGLLQFSGSFANSASTLAVENGATIQIPQPVVLTAGSLITGSGTVQAPSITSSAVVSPGATNAVLNLAGNYTQLLGGSIQFDIGGTTPGVNQSQVNVTGSASLDGLIALRFSPGYAPAVNSSNLVLIAGSVSGQFPFQDHFFLLGHNKRINAVYSPSNLVLATISAADPTNFSLTTVVEGQTFALAWPSEFTGYDLETKTNLEDLTWTSVPGVTNFYSETPMTSPQKFFRLFPAP